jgi:purine-binding chemotaxis protein CheW
MQLLLFELGSLRYALPAADVREILRAVAMAPLPKAPAIVEGIVNVRGTVVPVLDIRTRFRVPSKAVSHTDHLILASAGSRLVALRADRVLDLMDLDTSDIAAPGALVPGAEYFSGVARLADGPVRIHDLRTLLHDGEAAALDSALAAAVSSGVPVREPLRRGQAADPPVVSSEQAPAIMEERARLLVRTQLQAPVETTLEVVTFALAAERYAIETQYVRAVVRMVNLTPVPGAPAFVAGITNYRGQVLCVVDLRSVFEASTTGPTGSSRLIVVGVERVEFGVLADRVDAILRLPASEVLPLSGSVAGVRREYLRGVSRDAMMVVDGGLLLAAAGLFVDVPHTAAV